MIEVIISHDEVNFSAYFIDSQGYKTKFQGRPKRHLLITSIKEHFEMRKENYELCSIIKKEQSN